MLTFEKFHSTDVVDGRVVFRVIGTDNMKYEFAVSGLVAGMMAATLQAASTHLPEYSGPSVIPEGFQSSIGPELQPALLIALGGNLTIAVSLPQPKLTELKTAIAQLEQSTTPAAGSH